MYVYLMLSHQTDREGYRDPHGPRASPQDKCGEEPARAPEEESLNSSIVVLIGKSLINRMKNKNMRETELSLPPSVKSFQEMYFLYFNM